MSTVKSLDFSAHDSNDNSFRIKSILSYDRQLCVQSVNLDGTTTQFSLIDSVNQEIKSHIEVEVSGIVPKLFTNDVLVVVAYSNEANPDVTDIYGVDWKNGEIIWERTATKILEANHVSIKLPHRNIQGRFLFIDIKTGRDIDSLLEEKPKGNSIKYPLGYPESSIYFEWFSKFLKAQKQIPVKHCEYIRLSKQTILSYYITQENTLSNYLIVIDIHGKVLDKFLLASDLKGIGKDTFFIFEEQLIFITDQKTLNFYAL